MRNRETIINIARSGAPSAQWKAWIKALGDAGFGVNAVDLRSAEFRDISAQPGDVVLFDGMTPHLPRFIELIRSRCLDARIIVASEIHSFTIKYEVQYLHGAIYVAGPMPGDQFAAMVQSILEREMVA